MNVPVTIRAAGSPRRLLVVPYEIFQIYQPRLGSIATLIWLNLHWKAQDDGVLPPEGLVPWLSRMTGAPPIRVLEAIDTLLMFALIEPDGDNGFLVQEPLPEPAFLERFGSGDDEQNLEEEQPPVESLTEKALTARRRIVWEEDDADASAVSQAAAASQASAVSDVEESEGPSLGADQADFEAMIDIYHKRIGMMGPVQFEKLRFWVEEKQMSAEVVALAIDETARNADRPTIQYLESILRTWYNLGVRTFEDILKKKQLAKALRTDVETPTSASGREQRGRTTFDGMPNAGAYQPVDPEMVKKWKELFPDEYES